MKFGIYWPVDMDDEAAKTYEMETVHDTCKKGDGDLETKVYEAIVDARANGIRQLVVMSSDNGHLPQFLHNPEEDERTRFVEVEPVAEKEVVVHL